MLVDTDILIWYLRGHRRAKNVIDRLPGFSISAVTYMEIAQGLRNQQEFRLWKHFLRERCVQQVPIDQNISAKAVFWIEEYSLSHHLRMADVLIAATADVHGLDLLTGNSTDYRFLPGISLKIFKATP